MQQREPIYVTRKDTSLAKDRIVPYGGWTDLPTEAERKKIAMQLLKADNPVVKQDK